MYLKSIEVQGFKSFANKIVFEFHNGITGIVGPNGSGKSNVADAVRWVLGEQRVKQLRGGTMQDVIFSGTENRKPLSYAMVAITLDNSDGQLPIDFKEVTVTRKLYRSGESEYLINGSTCRLKDVNELFYDTGIGKEGYSIIGQGQIDKILSGKPEERRELFDEAAGIVKFKRRKNMSIKKLEDEKQNLVRVNDILSELERQVGPLERQAETARAYLKKKEELKKYDINLFLLESDRLKEQLDALEKKLQIASEELDAVNRSYEETKTAYEAMEEETDAVDARIEKSKTQLNETTLLKQQLEGEINLLKEQIHSVRMSDEHYDQRYQAIQSEMKEKQKQKEAFAEEKQKLKRELSEKQILEEEAKKALIQIQSQIADISSKVENAQSDIFGILNSRSSTKAKIQHYDTMLGQIQMRRAEIHKRLIEMKSADSEHDERCHVYEEELKEIAEAIRKLLEEQKKVEQQIQTLQEEIGKKNEMLRVGQTAYHREHSRLDSLKNMTERYDGYGNSIRRVMEQRVKEKGLLGVVADIIKVQKNYESAIETALGGSIQNIVTDNEDTAKRMIGFLKQNKYGRATFLPLTAIGQSQGFRTPEALKEPGVIGLANELVTVEERFRKLSDHLLGRTVVVDHIDHGIALSRKYRQTLRIVTIEGDLITPGGAMTGGAFKNSSNLLSRRREIEELEKTVRRLKDEMVETETALNASKQKRTGSYGILEQIKEQLQELYVKQNTAKMNLEQAKSQRVTAKEEIDQIYREGTDLEQQMKEIRENQESIQVELEISESLERDISSQIEIWQQETEQARKEENDAMHKNETIHLTCAGLEQKLEFLVENTERLSEELGKSAEALEELKRNKNDMSGEIAAKEQKILEIEETISNSKELFEEIKAAIAEDTKTKEMLLQKHKAFLQQRESLQKRMGDLDKEIFRLTNQKETCEEASEKQTNYMWEEYELTYYSAKEQRDETLVDLADIKKQIQNLKTEIRGLGSVNVNAIEDYKNVSERYEFLKTQQQDLVEAEKTLLAIIDELDAAMRAQFQERFAEIQKEFDQVFKQLFGGGKGTLELMEEEDILEAGIRIIAQPPGKKLQNMMQLSGGEKALTAISLLFAIQNLKPSPFCLLDEIEAALDDNNVVRFAQYLHKLTKNTQFIVITHRRGTMTAADRLYGITMQEKGVSTLVSVDLLENELET